MARIRDSASVSVSDTPLPRVPRRPPAPRRAPGRAEVRTVNPLVWEAALRLCEGDHSRLVIESTDAVVVLNPRT